MVVDTCCREGSGSKFACLLTIVVAAVATFWGTSGTAAAGTTLRINSGGPAVGSFAADAYFTGGSTATVSDAISGTSTPAVFQDERWGNWSYALPVANGAYTVKLYFAELYYRAPCAGRRVFSVDLGDTPANPDIANLDICAQVGPDAALVKTIPRSPRSRSSRR